MTQLDRPSFPRRLALACCLLALLLLRLIPTIIHPSLDWGDEIYQAIEPAHRLVYGTGLVTWEFAGHIRSWILPGAIAAILQATRLLAPGPGLYLPAIAVCFAALSLVPVLGTYVWCRRMFGPWPALAAASVAGLAPEMIYFGARTLAETTAAHVLIGGMFLAVTWPGGVVPSRRRSVGAGLLLGLACALRPQIAPALPVVMLWPGVPGRLRLAAAAAAALLAASVLDWITLGAPSASIWRYFLVNVGGASASFGTQPWYYFFLAEAAVWGAALPVPVALCLLGARRWSMPMAAALAILAAHMVIGHKEHRFIYPALALGAVSAGIGMAAAAAWLSAKCTTVLGWRRDVDAAAIVCTLAWAGLCAFVWTGPAMTTLRGRVHDELDAADYAASVRGICGIGMGPGQDAWVPYGGYSHMHQSVPLFWPRDQAAFGHEAAGFNLLLSAQPQAGYAALRCFGPVCVARRPGACAPVAPDSMPGRPG